MTKGKIQILAGTAVMALVGFANQAAMAQDAPSNAELQQRIAALEAEVQQSEMNSAAAANAAPAAPASGWWDSTTLSGRMYWDVTNITNKTNGGRVTTAQVAASGVTNGNGTNFDMKRLYIGIDHTFNDMFSASLTTDVTYDGTTGASQLFVKKAYLQVKIDPMLTIRVGSADGPWVPYVEGIYGYRYVEKVELDYLGYESSADWGVHALGSFFDGVINYDVAAINGANYKQAPTGGNANRFGNFDYEGRLSAVYDGFNLGIGGYSGHLGSPSGIPTVHTAQRVDAFAGYFANGLRVGVEYFNATNFSTALVQSAASDGSDGISSFASYNFLPEWTVFARYDTIDPNWHSAPTKSSNYYNVGITWTPLKTIDFSLAYKHDAVSNGTLSTANGTLGGSINGSYSEVGVWSDWQF